MPVLETLATPVFVETHDGVLPERMWPCPSRTVAFACDEWPFAMLAESKVTTTLAVVTGTEGLFTTTVASPVFDSTVARMTALPGAIAVINPEIDTVATAVFKEL